MAVNDLRKRRKLVRRSSPRSRNEAWLRNSNRKFVAIRSRVAELPETERYTLTNEQTAALRTDRSRNYRTALRSFSGPRRNRQRQNRSLHSRNASGAARGPWRDDAGSGNCADADSLAPSARTFRFDRSRSFIPRSHAANVLTNGRGCAPAKRASCWARAQRSSRRCRTWV